MPGRTGRWVTLVVLPLVLALYASYPPAGVLVRHERALMKVAKTPEEADRYKVRLGEYYDAEKEVTRRRWLPLALGVEDVERRVVERLDDGSYVEERDVYKEGRIKLGLDLAGGTELLYRLEPREGEQVARHVSEVIEILRRRIDPGNVKEYRIQPLEHDRVLIQVPQATPVEVEQLKRRLERMGRLEFKIAVPRGTGEDRFDRMYAEADAGRLPAGFQRMYMDDPRGGGEVYYLVREGEPEITGAYLASVQSTVDDLGGPAVGFQFDAVGSRMFGQITENNVGWGLAIILDDVLKSAPAIRERIGGAGIIEGRFTQQEVNDMITILRAGSLPMDIHLLQESTVGPQLGRDSIRRGLRSLAVAGLLVVAFIGVYYMACGLVADAALLMNLVLLAGVLCILGAALTLPGLAGVLLTVGMAVDANVLIFERIREETSAGKTPRIALRNGYDRAFTTIVDANVTTLITAVILYLVGTGPVRGFAVTLSFGILLSMFTALVVTRLAFETFTDRGWMKGFRMRSLLARPSIPFSELRIPAYVVSAIVVAVGAVAFFSRGSALYDIDFTGGSLVYVSLQEPTAVADVRSRLAGAGFADAEVQALQTGGASAGGSTQFAVRFKGAGTEYIREKVQPEVERLLREGGLLANEGDLELSRDRRALVLRVAGPRDELSVRRALNGEDPFALPHLAEVSPMGDQEQGKEVVARPYDLAADVSDRDVWTRVVAAFVWAGVETQQYVVSSCVLDEGGAGVELTLDQPMQWQLLEEELSRLGFPELGVAEPGRESESFLVSGPSEALVRFQKEFPTGAELRDVPAARIDGCTVRARLLKAFSEDDVRSFLEKQDVPRVYVALEDVTATSFRLELSSAPIRERLAEAFAAPGEGSEAADPVQRVVSIGATVAEELQGRALLAVVFASVAIVLYVAARFHALRFGVAAVIALVHDILITAGLIALADWAGVLGDVKINLAMLAAFLTILGYSLNDTIVVFDRIRENMGVLGRKRVSADLIDVSINQTLSRTLLTSLTTLMVVLVLFVLGGPVLRGLALTLTIGVFVGTYSSMFIASPVLLDWAPITHGSNRALSVVFLPVRLPFKALGWALGGGAERRGG
jgi:SecD/SecF fusion protein